MLNGQLSHTEAVLALANGYAVEVLTDGRARLTIVGSRWAPIMVDPVGTDPAAFLIADALVALAACECGICEAKRAELAGTFELA